VVRIVCFSPRQVALCFVVPGEKFLSDALHELIRNLLNVG